MPLPIDCPDSPYLCQNCQKRYDEGELSVTDITASRILYKILKDDAKFIKAFKTEGRVIILCKEENVGKLIGEAGVVVASLSNGFGCPVRIVGAGSIDKVAKSLIAPASVSSINEVYTSGKKSYRIHISSLDAGKLRMSQDSLKKLISSAIDLPVELILD